MNKRVLIGVILFLLVFLFWYFFIKDLTLKEVSEAQLSWNPSTEKDVKGYRVYYGDKPRDGECPTGGYVEKIDVGNKTSHKIKNLENKKTYYFSVTSYNQSGKESCFSEEMSKKIDIKFLDKIKNINLKK